MVRRYSEKSPANGVWSVTRWRPWSWAPQSGSETGSTGTVATDSPPVIVRGVGAPRGPCPTIGLTRCTGRVVWSASAISIKSIPLRAVDATTAASRSGISAHPHGQGRLGLRVHERVRHRDQQCALVKSVRRVSARKDRDVHEGHLVAEPPGDRLLDLDSNSRRQRVGLRREHQTAQTATELWNANPFPRAGEEQLTDQLVHVRGIRRALNLSCTGAHAQRIRVVVAADHSPPTCAWVVWMITVPCTAPSAAMHLPPQAVVSGAAPSAVARRAVTIQLTCTHGWGTPPGAKAQAPIGKVSVANTI